MKQKNIVFSDNNLELIKPILPGLPLSVFMTNFSPTTYNCINWHCHAAFQYCLVTEGAVDFLLLNRTYRVSKGSGIFINWQQMHFCKESSEEPSSYLCIDLPPAFLSSDEHSRIYSKYLTPVIQNPTPSVLLFSKRTESDRELLNLLKTIQDLLKEGPEFMEFEIQIAALKIWKLTVQKLNQRNNYAEQFDVNDNNRLRQILQYMQEHYSEKISIDDIAKQISLSKSECCRFFKKATGQTMFSYLTLLRVNKSMSLLSNSDISLAEIASIVGFCNQSYYSDCFKKTKGISPKKYRILSQRKPSDILPLDIDSH